jgi:hypothetical protein
MFTIPNSEYRNGKEFRKDRYIDSKGNAVQIKAEESDIELELDEIQHIDSEKNAKSETYVEIDRRR